MTMTFKPKSSDSTKANVKWEMKIDKLTLLLDPPDMLKDGMVSEMISSLTDPITTSHFGITHCYSPGSLCWQISIAGKAPVSTDPLTWSKKHAYILQVAPKQPKKPFLRLDINPEGLTPAGLAHLRYVLAKLADFPWPVWGLARVSRLDIAVDLYGVAVTDWVWDIPKKTSRELWCRGKEVRTTYLGAKRADFVAIYNKGKQKPSAAGGGALTRVEFRLKNPGLVSEMASVANPFADLVVFDPAKLPQFPDSHRMALRSLGQLHGRKTILNSFPKNCRLAVDKQLMNTEASWWDPDENWNAWHSA